MYNSLFSVPNVVGEHLENIKLIPPQKQGIRIALFKGASDDPSQISQLKKSVMATSEEMMSEGCKMAGWVQMLARIALLAGFSNSYSCVTNLRLAWHA